MKPSFLKPGDVVINSSGFEMVFRDRERRTGFQGRSWFVCEQYRGMNGPQDKGAVYVDDAQLVRGDYRRKAEVAK